MCVRSHRDAYSHSYIHINTMAGAARGASAIAQPAARCRRPAVPAKPTAIVPLLTMAWTPRYRSRAKCLTDGDAPANSPHAGAIAEPAKTGARS